VISSSCLCVLGALCGVDISLPEKVEALKGSCVFIPCTFDIDQTNENERLTDNAQRIWYKDGSPVTEVFNSDQPNAGLLKGEIFGTPIDKNLHHPLPQCPSE